MINHELVPTLGDLMLEDARDQYEKAHVQKKKSWNSRLGCE